MYFPYYAFNYPLRRKSDTKKQETKLARNPKVEDVTGNAKYTVFERTFCSSSEKTIEDGFFSGVDTRKYRKVSKTDRCHLVEAYNNDKDVYALAKDLGINRTGSTGSLTGTLRQKRSKLLREVVGGLKK